MSDTLLLLGDCIDRLRALPAASVSACVTDPPYHLTTIVQRFGKQDAAPVRVPEGGSGVYARGSRGFMGQTWDGGDIAFQPDVWREVFRVLSPGGYLLAFSGTRTYHRMTVAIEDAGFEIRDCIGWHYGSGFPKSHAVERNVPPEHAAAWKGWGTALKPAWEPIVMARVPVEGTVAATVLRYGTGAINIDACRVPHASAADFDAHRKTVEAIKARGGSMANSWKNSSDLSNANDVTAAGRWPANVILSHAADCDDAGCAPGCPVAAMDAQSGGEGASRYFNTLPVEADDAVTFIYAAKAARKEREEGCDGLPASDAGFRNGHPTVKPVAVMRHLVRLVTPPGGVVLDPFTGSGSTGVAAVREGVHFVGIEREAAYMEIAKARIAHAKASR